MAFGLPKMGDITAQINDKFGEMMSELKAIKNLLTQILAQLQKENTVSGQ